MVKSLKLPKKTFNEIELAWQAIQKMDVRTKMKALRQIGFDISQSYIKKDITVEQINLYIEILKTASRTQSFPQNVMRMLTKLIADKLELSGNQAAKIITKLSGEIIVESGIIMLGDPAVAVTPLTDFSDKNLLSIINAGQRFLFSTGGDGIFDVHLRIIEASEPVLTPKEYKFVENSSETAIISIDSGQIMVEDLGHISASTAKFLLKVEPGNYKVTVMVFHMPNKLYSYYIVMCKTTEISNNNLAKIDILG